MSFLLPAALSTAGAGATAGATMGIVGSTGAIGSTLLSSAIAPTAITAATTSAFVPSLLVSSAPSFLGSISSAFSAIKPYMEIISPVAQVAQGINSIMAGQTQADMYRLQQLQLRAKLDNDRLNYTRQGNDVLRRLLQSNASAAARGYAGGVKGFEGSSALLMDVNEKYAGNDMETIQQNIATSATYGQIQDSMLSNASDKAVTGSYYDFFTSVGKAAYLYGNLKTV
jgi:hypothetical protein